MKILIAFFSHAGENWADGRVVKLEKGNTNAAAEIIRDQVGGELFEVRALKPYPADYRELIARTKQELDEGARPELAAWPDSLDGYDLIFIGYPNWWNTMPMPMYTFLGRFDLTGKTLAPFCTNEGGSMGMGEREMRTAAKGANVLPGLSIRGADIGAETARIRDWAERIVKGAEHGTDI